MRTKRIKKLIEELKGKMLKCDNLTDYLSDYTDLKLYAVSSYVYNNNIDSVYFEWFCEDSFEDFILFCEDLDIEFTDFKRVGRTSSFYCFEENQIDIEDFATIGEGWFDNYSFLTFAYDQDWENIETFEDIINFYEKDFKNKKLDCLHFCCDCWEGNLKERIEKTLIEDIKSIDYLLELLGNYKKVYDYIQSFKDNQVKLFKEYYKQVKTTEI